MRRPVFVLAVCAFCVLWSCGDDSPVSPSVEISSFYGTWNGSLSTLQVNLYNVTPAIRELNDFECTMEFDLFNYSLYLEYESDGLKYTHEQSGGWQWDESSPDELVFYLRNEEFEQTLGSGRVTQVVGKSTTKNATWMAKLEFKDNNASIRVYDAAYDFSYMQFTENTEINIFKSP
jgi:hypothetical protein